IFEGDAAMRELRARLALGPDQMPDPPLYQAKDPIFGVVARLMGVMVLAAVGALGFLWITAPHAAPPPDGQAAGSWSGGVTPGSSRVLEAQQPAPAAKILKAARAREAPSSSASWKWPIFSRAPVDEAAKPPAPPAPRISAPAAPRTTAPRTS